MRAPLAIALLLIAPLALAHNDAAWIEDGKYKNAAGELCCGSRDCGEFHNGRIETRPNGYRIDGVFRVVHPTSNTYTDVEVHELIPYSKATPSPDGKFWRCQWGGERKCFFAPPNGS